MSFGETTRICRARRIQMQTSGARELTLGVRPLKNADGPSVRRASRITASPPTLLSKFWFCMRVCTWLRACNGSIDADGL
jgi:hypothetical protein